MCSLMIEIDVLIDRTYGDVSHANAHNPNYPQLAIVSDTSSGCLIGLLEDHCIIMRCGVVSCVCFP